jgi:hypothetical protein
MAKAGGIDGRELGTAAARKAESLIALIERRKERIAEDYWDIGAALLELQKKKLYAAIGYRSMEQLVVMRKIVSWTMCKQLVEIAGSMDRDDAVAIGSSEKAYYLARYVDRTPAIDTVKAFVASGVPINRRTRPINEVSAADLRAATKRVRAKTAPLAADKELADAQREAKRAEAKAKKRGVPIEIEVFRRDGELLFRAEGALTELTKLFR